uniref:Uncharacterized protein n=1 Tax=uncultured prokaryote TaxID=198431 RepID=A0A0H5QPJ9_9ZZZZ|nr:hypothetical protein [uncultured prokaryote]
MQLVSVTLLTAFFWGSHKGNFGRILQPKIEYERSEFYLCTRIHGYLSAFLPSRLSEIRVFAILTVITLITNVITLITIEEKMTRISISELRRRGVSDEDIKTAKTVQDSQRRIGAPVQSLGVIVGVAEPRQRHNPNPPISLTEKALRKRGTYDQAALLLDQQALQENSPERAALARHAANTAKELATTHQLEFDFFGGGNVSIAFQYQDAVTERLFEIAPTTTKAHQAQAVLWQICRNLGWQSYECTKTAADLCEIMRIKAPNMAAALDLLEQVGAIHRVKRGRIKIITVTPEGAFRGNVNNHGKAVERFKLDVIDGGLVS